MEVPVRKMKLLLIANISAKKAYNSILNTIFDYNITDNWFMKRFEPIKQGSFKTATDV